ncbi:MAG: nuclear transport factor 2 family protein [Chromatiales bacterium]|jgi:ketosteroid isomerase-like protein
MTAAYATAQDAEDAFYDALDESDPTKMMSVWEDSDEVACLLPMQALVRGRREVERLWQALMDGDFQLDLSVTHIQWTEAGDMAIHLVEERVSAPGGQPPPPPLYGINVFRRGSDGWRLLVHQNSPSPPPPGMSTPGIVPPGAPR